MRNETNRFRLIAHFTARLLVVMWMLGCAPVAYQDRAIVIPSGVTEADVIAHLGRPSYVTQTNEGGKVIVYENTTVTPGDITQSRIGRMLIESQDAPRTSKRILTFTIGPDGIVKACRFIGPQ